MKNLIFIVAFNLLVLNFVSAEQQSSQTVAGQISEWISQLREPDDAKRNSAVLELSHHADDALPQLQKELKTADTGGYRWWLQVANQACEEKRSRPDQISATPIESKGLKTCEDCKNGDGLFVEIQRDGVQCWEVPKNGHYLYFSASDEFRKKAFTKLVIEVEYLDIGIGDIRLDYDSNNTRAPLNGAYEEHPKQIHCQNSGSWRTTRFELPNARFRGSENGQTDFRFRNGGDNMIVRSVRVWPTNASND